MRAGRSPESLLVGLGIDSAGDVDLEAIAWTLGAKVRYRALDGCEARIVGLQEKAIITVNSNSSPQRQRFSIAHELGHWALHRGLTLECRADAVEVNAMRKRKQESAADKYASRLLMPEYLLGPELSKSKKLDIAIIQKIASEFDVSLTAAAIRCVESDHYPSLLVCHGVSGRKWFVRSSSVPERWFPQAELDHESSAFDIVFGKEIGVMRRQKIGADAWFDRREAARFEIYEQSVRIGRSESLTVLQFTDDEMLIET